MASPPKLDLRLEDFPDAAWAENLVRALNSFGKSVRGGLDSGLTFQDNFDATWKELEIVTKSSWVTLSTLNGWKATKPVPRVRRVGPMVELVGLVTGGTPGIVALQVDKAYRPIENLFRAGVSGIGHTYSAVEIRADGAVVPETGNSTEFHLDFIWLAGDPNPAAPNSCFPIRMSTGLNGTPKTVIMARLVDKSSQDSLEIGASVRWRQAGKDNIDIIDIPGILDDRTYRATFLCIGG